jgi:hypothetical protein
MRGQSVGQINVERCVRTKRKNSVPDKPVIGVARANAPHEAAIVRG